MWNQLSLSGNHRGNLLLHTVKKVHWNNHVVTIKHEIDDSDTQVIQVDTANAFGEMVYNGSPNFYIINNTLQIYAKNDIRRIRTTRQGYVYVGEGETETPDIPTRFIKFPPEETTEQWASRMEPRITLLARCYADGVPGHHDRFEGLATKVESADDAGQMLIGFLRWQWTQLSGGHTTAEDGVFITRAELEDFVEKMEARFPDKAAVSKFYYRHPHNHWAATSSIGQIFIPNDNHMHGEKIHDTLRVYIPTNTPRQGARDEPSEALTQATENSERDIRIIKAMFVNATLSPNDELITELTVEPEEYTPPERNTNLATLTVGTDDGALTLNRPAGSTPTTGFSPDITQYLVTLPTGKTAVGIVATAENSDATITGTGDQTGITTTRTVNIVVTSEDTHATKTYEITISPLSE